MHVDLTTTSQSLAGADARRTFCLLTTDPTCVVHILAADTTGVSGVANGIVVQELTYRSPKVEITDGSSFLYYVLKQGRITGSVWVDAPPALGASLLVNAFGDGSDGAVTFDGATTILGIAPSANTYTLTRDIFCSAITINAGVSILTAGYKIFCTGTLTNAGTISNNGGAGGAATAGVGGTGGTAGAAGTCGLGGTAGGAGATGSGAGTAGTNLAAGFPNPPAGAFVGGAGGGDGTHAAAAAGTVTASVASKGGARSILAALAVAVFGQSGMTVIAAAGSGGGGGAGDNADAGGGGGGGGAGCTWVAAVTVVNTGSILANGGQGGAGASTAHDAGGGGGGGGGVVYLLSRTQQNTGTIAAAGGAGGPKVGANGVAGTAGAAGVVLSLAA